MYRVFGQLPEVPSLESYERTLRDIKTRLIDAGANVALVSPPVLGEDRFLALGRMPSVECRCAFTARVLRFNLSERTFTQRPIRGRRSLRQLCAKWHSLEVLAHTCLCLK